MDGRLFAVVVVIPILNSICGLFWIPLYIDSERYKKPTTRGEYRRRMYGYIFITITGFIGVAMRLIIEKIGDQIEIYKNLKEDE